MGNNRRSKKDRAKEHRGYSRRKDRRKRELAAKRAAVAKTVVPAGKAGEKMRNTLGQADVNVAPPAPLQVSFRKLNEAKRDIAEIVDVFPSRQDRDELGEEMKKATAADLTPSQQLSPATAAKLASGAVPTPAETAEIRKIESEIADATMDSLEEMAKTLGRKLPKYDAVCDQVGVLLGTSQETLTQLDVVAKALQRRGYIPEEGQKTDPGTLTYFNDDGGAITLGPLLAAGLYTRTVQFVKGNPIDWGNETDKGIRKAIINTDNVAMKVTDATAPAAGDTEHLIISHAARTDWVTYAAAFKADDEEKTRPYGNEPQSLEHRSYPVSKDNSVTYRYCVEVEVPATVVDGLVVPQWPTGAGWTQITQRSIGVGANGTSLEVYRYIARAILNVDGDAIKATHKETLAGMLPDLVQYWALPFGERPRIEIRLRVKRHVPVRLTPCLDSHVKAIVQQGIASLGSTSGMRDVSNLVSFPLAGTGLDVLFQSANATALVNGMSDLFGSVKYSAPTDRVLKP